MLLVTGGAGFIGSNFLHYIKRYTDEEVLVIDNLTYSANESYIPKTNQFKFYGNNGDSVSFSGYVHYGIKRS